VRVTFGVANKVTFVDVLDQNGEVTGTYVVDPLPGSPIGPTFFGAMLYHITDMPKPTADTLRELMVVLLFAPCFATS